MQPWLYLLLGAILGAAIGWLIAFALRGSRPPDTRVENELRQQLAQRETELAGLRSQLDRTNDDRAAAQAGLTAAEQQRLEFRQRLDAAEAALTTSRDQLAQVNESRATAEARLAAAQKLLQEQREVHQKALADAREAHDKAVADLREAFKALSTDALRQAQPDFLRLASETFARLQEAAKGDLAKRQESIAALIGPLKEQLETYQRRLAQSESNQSCALGEVKKHLETLAQQSLSLSNETLQLRRVLSSNQARGRWGEETLRRVVEAAGMSAHCDFTEQVQGDEGKPDLMVRLPGERVILVDAKVPDLDFAAASDSADPVRRAEALATHATRLKQTIRQLAERDYPRQFPNSLDHVVLFLPAESLFSAALEGDRDLLVWAAARKILLATPASLIALLRSVAVSWQQHAQTENARAIAAAAQELYGRVCKFTEHFERIRAGLQKANCAFNDAVGSYERSVRPSGERLASLGAGLPNRELPGIEPVSDALRLPPARNGTAQ